LDEIGESALYTGRAVAAIAGDEDYMRHNGKRYDIGMLAKEYGFTDIDGRQPVANMEPLERMLKKIAKAI